MNLNTISFGEVDAIRSQLKNEMNLFLPVWKLSSKYIAPRRLKVDGAPKIDGNRKDENIIRNVAGRSLRTFVSGMMNGATPRARPWFNLVTFDPNDMVSSNVKTFLKQSEKAIQNVLQVSNFYRVAPLVYKDVGVFSNAAFAQLAHPRFGCYFYPYTIGSYAFSCDHEGNTVMFTREAEMTIRQVVEEFAALDPAGKIIWDNIDTAIKSAWEQARYLDRVRITQVIVPNPKYNPVTARESLNPLSKKFQCFTYTLGMGGPTGGLPFQGGNGFRDQESGEKKSPYLKITGYNYFPVVTPRWEVEPEGNYGIDGPGWMALSDIMTLQEQEKLRMEGIYKNVRPPMVGHASMRRHHSSILAGGITYVDDRAMNMGFKPAFQVAPSLADLVANQREIEDAIRSAFYEDLFMMLSSQDLKSHVTAAEVQERASERMAALAPVLGQWDFDFSGKVISNALTILEDQGRLPTRPAEMRSEIRPEYTSILAQAAKASTVSTIERSVNFIASTAQATGDTSLVGILNYEKLLREYADSIGLDPQLLSTDEEFAEARAAIAQRAQENAQFERSMRQAEAAKLMSDTKVNQGSLLDTMATASRV